MKTPRAAERPPLTAGQSADSQSSLAGEWRCSEPVALFIFNRPDTTRRVLDAIRVVQPSVMFVVADGPRGGHPEDAATCAAARALIDQVDWHCAVSKNYAGENLGIRRRVTSGLDWVFAHAEEAIVLEDDCLPHPTFFRFCEELLARYRSDDRIVTISGTDLTWGEHASPYSYRFSRYPVIWGWATWRRAWQLYDPMMCAWPPSLQSKWLEGYLGDVRAAQYWAYVFNTEYTAQQTWDHEWTFSAWQHDRLSVHPAANLVSNIGFGQDPNHTLDPNSRLANRLLKAMLFPLRHPETTSRDAAADDIVERNAFSGNLTRMLERARQQQLQQRAPQEIDKMG